MRKKSFFGTMQKSYVYILLLSVAAILAIGSYACRTATEATFRSTEKNMLAKMQLVDNLLTEIVGDIEAMTEQLEGYGEYFISSDGREISMANAYLTQTMNPEIIGACVLQIPDGRVYTYNPDGIFLDVLQLNLFCGSNAYGKQGLKWYIDDDPDRISPYPGYYVVCTDIPCDDVSYTKLYYFVKKSVLTDILSKIHDKDNIAIIMDNGKQFLISDREGAREIMRDNTDILFRLGDFNASNYDFQKYNDHYLMACYKSPESNFVLISVYEENVLCYEVHRQTLIVCLLLLVFVILALVVYGHLRKNFIIPFDLLTKNMESGESGHSFIKGCAEIEYLSQCYNNIHDEISSLKSEKEACTKKVREIEMTAMHKQLTPHFFYNTLSNIRFMAVMRGQEEISAVIAQFAEMNKYLFSHEDEFVTLKEETEFIKNYVSLINIRYFNSISAFYLIDEELYEKKIPIFSLQPIVENAIVHGLAKKLNDKKKAFLRITASADNDQMVISICDNGSGIPEETMEKIMSMPQFGRQNMGIGLYSTLSRLEYYYGDKYSFEVKSQQDESTEFIFRIPVESENQD